MNNDGNPEGAKSYAVQIANLNLTFKDRNPLFRDFSLAAYEGETLALTGDSGCGKSTLLNCISGLIPRVIEAQISGEVLLFGKPPASYTRAQLAAALGVVFQNPDAQLFCDSVEDEIAFGLENLCVPPAQIAQRIDEALDFTGLHAYRDVSPSLLSGGQKQLVVLAAVLSMKPRLLLLDESLSQLDSEAQKEMLALFVRLKAKGQTMIMVDHEDEHLHIADRCVKIPEPDDAP
jgi:energy-coupling factor transport system ATP-binding protein